MSDSSDVNIEHGAMDGDDHAAISSRIPYLVIQSGCMIAASELVSKIDSETQSRDEIAQATVKIANRIYERFVELSQERRKNRRHKVDLPAKILIEDKVLDCSLWNISHGGAMVSPLLSLHVGVSVGLKIGRNKPIPARIAAIGAKQTNLAFLSDEIEPDRLQGIIAKLLEANRAAGD
jgi:hypothetical protein